MKKAFPAFVLTLLIIAGLPACAQDTGEEPQPGDNPSEDAEGEDGADSEGEEPGVDTDETETLSDTGTYVGLADNSFFEVRLNEESFIVLMLTEDTREEFEALALETGDGVNFDYYTNEDKQNVLIAIERK